MVVNTPTCDDPRSKKVGQNGKPLCSYFGHFPTGTQGLQCFPRTCEPAYTCTSTSEHYPSLASSLRRDGITESQSANSHKLLGSCHVRASLMEEANPWPSLYLQHRRHLPHSTFLNSDIDFVVNRDSVDRLYKPAKRRMHHTTSASSPGQIIGYAGSFAALIPLQATIG
jgi:hypothetical protein